MKKVLINDTVISGAWNVAEKRDSIGKTAITYTFNQNKQVIEVDNNSSDVITVTISGSSTNVAAYGKFRQDFGDDIVTSVTLVSNANSSSFTITAYDLVEPNVVDNDSQIKHFETQMEELVADKADKSEIAAIANANAEAEMVSIRSGANGIVYDTAGDAVISQVGEIAGYKTVEVVDGEYIKMNGDYSIYEPYSRTNIIELKAGESMFAITTLNNPTNVCALYKYDVDSNPESAISTADGSLKYVYTATEDAEFIAASGSSDLKVYRTNVTSEAIDLIISKLLALESIGVVKELQTVKNGGINDGALSKKKLNYYSKEEILFGKTSAPEAEHVDSSFYSGYTNRFMAPEFISKIELNARASANGNIKCAVIIDKTQADIIAEIGTGNMPIADIEEMADFVGSAEYTGFDGTINTQLLSYDLGDLETNKKMVYVFIYTEDNVNMGLISTVLNTPENDDYAEYIIEYDDFNYGAYRNQATGNYGFLGNVTNSLNFSNSIIVYEALYMTSQQRIEKVLANEYLLKMFDSSLHIGDSLSSEATDLATGEAISYPKYVQRLTGWSTVDRIATPGWTATQMWNHFNTENPDITPYDAVFIYLGTNQGLTETGTGLFSDDHTDNYKLLIEYIQANSPNTKIFLMGLTYGDKYSSNIAIKNMATTYDVAYLEMFHNGFYELRDVMYHPNDDPVHFGKIGYMTVARVMVNQLILELAENYSRYEVEYT